MVSKFGLLSRLYRQKARKDWKNKYNKIKELREKITPKPKELIDDLLRRHRIFDIKLD